MNDDARARFGQTFQLGSSIANVAANAERWQRWVRLARAGIVMLVILSIGTYGYWYLGEGKHSLVEALYMTVISISTVGFNEVIPITSDSMRLFTMTLIFLGGASVVYFLAAIAAFIIEGDVLYGFWRRRLERGLRKAEGHIVVVGLGRVGAYAFAELFPSRVEVVGVDHEPGRVERLISDHGEQILFSVGEAFDEGTLTGVGIQRAHAVIAALPDDRDNFLLAATARELNPDVRLLIRLVDPANAEMLEDLRPDAVVHPPTITGRRVANMLLRAPMLAFTDALIAADTHRRELVELECDQRLAGRRLGELALAQSPAPLIVGHRRRADVQATFRPGPETAIQAGDVLIALGHRRELGLLATQLASTASAPRTTAKPTEILSPLPSPGAEPATWRGHVVVAGAGAVGRAIAAALRRLGTRVVIIERDPAQLAACDHADPDLRLVVGDVFQREVLLDAGLPDARAFVTALQTLRDNLFLCAVVRHANPRAQLIARVGSQREARRLKAVGAMVINPGEIGGVHLARLGIHPELVSFAEGLEATLERSEQLAVVPIAQACPIARQTLGEAALQERTGCVVLGLRAKGQGAFEYQPSPATALRPGGAVLALGEAQQLAELRRLLGVTA